MRLVSNYAQVLPHTQSCSIWVRWRIVAAGFRQGQSDGVAATLPSCHCFCLDVALLLLPGGALPPLKLHKNHSVAWMLPYCCHFGVLKVTLSLPGCCHTAAICLSQVGSTSNDSISLANMLLFYDMWQNLCIV